MKLAIAISCVLFSSTIGKAQLTYLSQNRVVSAQSEIRRSDFPNPGEDFHGFDEQSQSAADFGPFMATVTATAATDAITNQGPATATAWQESTLSDTEIHARGGVADINFPSSFGIGSSFANSSTDIVFSVSEPLRAHLSGDMLWTATRWYQDTFFNGGSVGYTLMGPNVDLVRAPQDDSHLPPATVFDPPRMQHFRDEFILFPGQYTLAIIARNGADSDEWANVPVSFEVHMEVLPIPEPNLLSVMPGAFLLILLIRRYWLAHLGK